MHLLHPVRDILLLLLIALLHPTNRFADQLFYFLKAIMHRQVQATNMFATLGYLLSCLRKKVR